MRSKKRGFENVRAVRGVGKEMEKMLEYNNSFYGGANIINPITKKVIVIPK